MRHLWCMVSNVSWVLLGWGRTILSILVRMNEKTLHNDSILSINTSFQCSRLFDQKRCSGFAKPFKEIEVIPNFIFPIHCAASNFQISCTLLLRNFVGQVSCMRADKCGRSNVEVWVHRGPKAWIVCTWAVFGARQYRVHRWRILQQRMADCAGEHVGCIDTT